MIFQWKEVLYDVRRDHYHILSDLSWAHQHVMVSGYQGHFELVVWINESWNEMIGFYGETWFDFYVHYQLWHEGQSGVDIWMTMTQVSSGLLSSQNGLGLNGNGSIRLEKVLDDGHFSYFDLTIGIWFHSVDIVHTPPPRVRDSIHTSASLISSLSSMLSTVRHPWLMLSYKPASSFISNFSK